MKTQAELLQGTNIPSDTLPGITFTAAEQDFLTVVEGFATNEWDRVSAYIGIPVAVEYIPEQMSASCNKPAAGR